MIASAVVLVPVLDRPDRVEGLCASLRGSLAAAEAHPLFLVSPGDTAELDAVRAAGADHVLVTWEPGPGDAIRKWNLGWRLLADRDAEWGLMGADDLRFEHGWLDAALRAAHSSGACVVGTNDGGNSRVMRGIHSTHPLVHRDYVACGTIDDPDGGNVLHPGYGHSFCDDELVQTAMWRGTWRFAADSQVTHLHPDWGHGARDATYEKGHASFVEDQALYYARRHLWGLS